MLKFLLNIFDEQASASFARLATAVTVLTGCFCLVYVVLRSHTLPDATLTLGLAAWMTAPYAINKSAAAFARPNAQPGDVPTIAAGATTRTPTELAITIGLWVLTLGVVFLLLVTALKK